MKVQDLFEAPIVPPVRQPIQSYSPFNKQYMGAGGRMHDKDTSDDKLADDRAFAQRAASRAQYKNYGRAEPGEVNGKPFNIVASIVGPKDRLRFQVDKFLDHHRNNYHEFVDIKVHPTGEEGIAAADIYINAQPQSLLKRAIDNGYYADSNQH